MGNFIPSPLRGRVREGDEPQALDSRYPPLHLSPTRGERADWCMPRDIAFNARAAQRARVSASQTPPPIMKPPEMRDNSLVRRAEKNFRTRPASTA